jgi:hypothetical protein
MEPMGAREALHRLIDEMPEEDLSTAERVLQGLRALSSPHVPPDQAPFDDEPDEDDFDGGLTEARAEIAAGRVVSHEEVKRRWGLPLVDNPALAEAVRMGWLTPAEIVSDEPPARLPVATLKELLQELDEDRADR